MRRVHSIWFVLLLALNVSAEELTIEITKGVTAALPIAIVPFGGQQVIGDPQRDIAAIVASDLKRSGRFNPLPSRDMLERPSEGSTVNFQNWRVLGMDNLVVGKIAASGAGMYTVQFQLYGVFQGEQLLGLRIPAKGDDLRRVAHHISDLIYEKLTGERGAFNTRMAYVTASGVGKDKSYALLVADADGFSPRTVLRSRQPIMSPAWSPDGARLAYVSFENRRAEVYAQDVATGSRQRIAGYEGINGAPAWSPDGRRLALTLSRSGSPDIYVFDVGSRNLARITDSPAIDTEPTWSPDGRHLVFTSDRSGRPQLYEVSALGGAARRLTFEGDYNAGAVYSSDGKKLALVHGAGGRYRIAVLDVASRGLSVLSEGPFDEGPSFAPNDAMLLYASQQDGRGVLAAVSVDGSMRQILSQQGDVREPVWSPYPPR